MPTMSHVCRLPSNIQRDETHSSHRNWHNYFVCVNKSFLFAAERNVCSPLVWHRTKRKNQYRTISEKLYYQSTGDRILMNHSVFCGNGEMQNFERENALRALIIADVIGKKIVFSTSRSHAGGLNGDRCSFRFLLASSTLLPPEN